MDVRRIIALLLLAVAIAPPAVLAHSHKKKGLEIVHPWIRAMFDSKVVNIPLFMKIKNSGKTGDKLLSATTPIAASVELIDLQAIGSSKLPTVVRQFEIAAGRDLELTPEGPRLLLNGVKKQFQAYDSFKMTLVFEKTGRMLIDVMVEEAETAEPHKH